MNYDMLSLHTHVRTTHTQHNIYKYILRVMEHLFENNLIFWDKMKI
jgi:hypothetical protein